jgi:hypothetical protein
VKVSGKRPKVAEKIIALAAKISRSRTRASLKRPSGGDILPVKSAKPSKGAIPYVIALAIVACIMPKMRVLHVSIGTGVLKAVKSTRVTN